MQNDLNFLITIKSELEQKVKYLASQRYLFNTFCKVSSYLKFKKLLITYRDTANFKLFALLPHASAPPVTGSGTGHATAAILSSASGSTSPASTPPVTISGTGHPTATLSTASGSTSSVPIHPAFAPAVTISGTGHATAAILSSASGSTSPVPILPASAPPLTISGTGHATAALSTASGAASAVPTPSGPSSTTTTKDGSLKQCPYCPLQFKSVNIHIGHMHKCKRCSLLPGRCICVRR